MEEQLWKKTLNRDYKYKNTATRDNNTIVIMPSFTASDSIKEITCL